MPALRLSKEYKDIGWLVATQIFFLQKVEVRMIMEI